MAVDESPHKLDIIRALLQGKPIAKISQEFGLSQPALYNYRAVRLKRLIAGGDAALAQECKELEKKEVSAIRDCVMEDVSKVRSTAWKLMDGMVASIPENGKLDCDVKASAGLLREIRQNAELEARLNGRLQDKGSTQVNVVILSSHSSTAPEPEPKPQTPAAPGDQVLDAEWSEIAPGD